MSKKIAVTGRPGCGKTTLCKKVFEDFSDNSGGIITEEIREEGSRVGFRVEDLSTGETELLSHVDYCSGPSIGKYSVCLDQFNSLAPAAIEQGLEVSELLIIDEIGPMELKSEDFVRAVGKTLEKDIDCLFTIHKKSNHQLLKKIREKFELVGLTRKNRDELYRKISEELITGKPVSE
ncbi:NTPase [Candidatus Bipolaricaulota bacterium]|nr:NTPase [Candidatus Bipolaricaulota bacterium]